MAIQVRLRRWWLAAGAVGYAHIACPHIARASPSRADSTVHGLWVWKSATVLSTPEGTSALRDFCRSAGVTEVYVSVAARDLPSEERDLVRAIDVLHRSGVRVEALISSTEADEPGRHRDTFLEHVRTILEFNHQHPGDRFDGLHLDIEPQQRPENKGTGNLRFLSDLVDTYKAVFAIAQPEQLTVNADIQNKLLKGTEAERAMLLSALPRFTLMLYELSQPTDAANEQVNRLRQASHEYLTMAYEGLTASHLAKLAIALRTPDYGERLPQCSRFWMRRIDPTRTTSGGLATPTTISSSAPANQKAPPGPDVDGGIQSFASSVA